MESPATEEQHFRSCEILFGSELTISSEFLDYLQLSGLKTAYRKRAMETHPDRIHGNGRLIRQRNNDSFHAVQEAYEDLLVFLTTKEKARQRAARKPEATVFPPRKRPPASPLRPIILPDEKHRGAVYANTERLYRGDLPHRPLLFGHFLYYSGLTNWRTIARILFWQRIERPRLGELGHRFGIFKHEDITRILRNKVPLQPFGQTARRLGIVTENQLQVLIVQQQRLQKKFGTILLEKNLVNHYELHELLLQFRRHNADILTQ